MEKDEFVRDQRGMHVASSRDFTHATLAVPEPASSRLPPVRGLEGRASSWAPLALLLLDSCAAARALPDLQQATVLRPRGKS